MEENQSLFDLQVDHAVDSAFKESSRWARLFCILSFIIMGVFLLAMVLAFSALSSLMSSYLPEMGGRAAVGAIAAVLIFVLVVFGVLIYFLYKAAILIRQGTDTQSQSTLNEGLRFLSNYFTMLGILTILGALVKLIGLF